MPKSRRGFAPKRNVAATKRSCASAKSNDFRVRSPLRLTELELQSGPHQHLLSSDLHAKAAVGTLNMMSLLQTWESPA